MRKIFNTLKSLLATAVMVSMLGTASLTTSCVDEYDDTAIRKEIGGVKKDLQALTERVSALESKLNSEVAALKSMINDLNVVVSAEKVGDDWKIVLADGTEFTVYGPVVDTDTDTDTDEDTYLAPKKDTDGVYYWAIISTSLDEATTEEWLLVDGEKVPVFGEECDCEPVEPTEPCNCELKLMVDEEDGTLLISIDGGQTYVDTGISATGCDCDDEEGEEPADNCIIEDVDIWSKPGYAIFTLVGGETVVVEIAQDGAGIVANIKGGRLNFTFGEQKSAELDLKNVIDCAVMEKPEGWRAKVEGNLLVVTAPAEAAVTDGSADAEGVIRLHATSEEGTCKIAKVKVSTNAGLTLTVDPKTGDIVINNPIVATMSNHWGETNTDFAPFKMGLAPIDEFDADPIAYVETVDENYSAISFIGSKMYEGPAYQEGVCDVMVIETNIADVYMFSAYDDLPEGEQFAVWVCPIGENGYSPVAEDMVYGYYKPMVAKVETLGASFCDVDVKIYLSGADDYEYAVDVASNWYDESTASYETYLNSALMEWKTNKPTYAEYGMDYFFAYGMSSNGEVDFEGSLAEFQAGEYEPDLLKPNTKYVLVALPIEEGKAYEDYTVEDILLYEFTTAGIVAGGDSEVTIVPVEKTYTSIKASIEVSSDVIAVYWNYFDPTDENILAGGDTAANYLLSKGYAATQFPVTANKTYGLSMGQEITLAAIAMNAKGEYTFVAETMKTQEMVYSTDTVSIDEITPGNNSISLKLSVSGGNVVKYRAYPLATYNLEYYTNDEIQNILLTNVDEYYNTSTVIVADGTVKGRKGTWDAATNTLTMTYGLYNGTDYTVFVAAQFEDGSWTNNLPSAAAKPALTLDPFFAEGTEEAQAAYEALGTPMIFEPIADGTWLDFSVKFDKLTEGAKVHVMVEDNETWAAQAGNRENVQAAYVVDNGSPLESADDYLQLWVNNRDNKLYWVIEDAEGNYYGTFEYDLSVVYDAIMGGGNEPGGMEPLAR